MRRLLPARLAPLALAIAIAAGCGSPVVNPVTGQTERSVMSESDEIAEGRKAHQEVLKEYGVYANPKVQAYVNEVGQRLARQTERANLQWTFTVVDSPEINAFALPGGYVYVTRGIMAYMQSEADLAGVMGHEIGHVTARHTAQRATRAQNAGLGVLAATVLGAVIEGATGARGVGDLVGQVSQSAAAGYVASFSREQESQADALGAEYLSRNRIDPRHMIDVIRLLRDQEAFAADAARAEGRAAPSGPNWLATHPSNEKRLQDIQQIAQRYQAQGKTSYTEDGRARYLQVVDGLAFGESREQGVTRGRQFFHEPLGIALTAPAGWKIQNAADSIAVVSPTADAGLVIRVVPAEAGRDHAQILQRLKLEQPRGERTTLNGLAATRFAGVVRNAQGQAQAVDGTLVTGPGGQVFLVREAGRDAAAVQRAQGGLREALASFRPLSAADRAAARPWALRTVPYPRGGFAELARQSPVDVRAEAQLRLLNGFYAGGEPAPGQPVKVIVAAP